MIDQFKEKAKEWDTIPWKNELAEEAYQQVIKRIGIDPAWKMFDIGGGTGLFSLKFLANLSEVTVVDTSKGMLDILREKINLQQLRSVDIKECELDSNTLPAEQFGLAVSMMTLHHIEKLAELFHNMYNALLPGGSVALIDLASEDGDFHPNGVEYVHNGFEADYLETLLKQAGFTHCRTTASLSVTKPNNKGIEKSYPILLVTADKD